MKKKIILSVVSVIFVFSLVLWGVTPKNINASKVVNLVQSNYKSITINDKQVKANTKKQYLIDDFIPRLSVYTLKVYDGELPDSYSYKVNIEGKDGSEIILLDNNYLIVNNSKYKIIDGTINLNKFYYFIH